MTARFDMLIFGLRFDLFFRVVWRPGEQEAPALTAVLLRPRRLAWPRTSPFHGGNTGSNPVGDASLITKLSKKHDSAASSVSRPCGGHVTQQEAIPPAQILRDRSRGKLARRVQLQHGIGRVGARTLRVSFGLGKPMRGRPCEVVGASSRSRLGSRLEC